MRLSIITINYNGSEKTLKLLKSLAEQTDPAQSNPADHQQRGRALSGASKDFEIIVVDNASEEQDFHNLKEEISDTILIRNDENLGFSGGNNVGVQEALKNGVEWVFLLNNDTWVESGFIASLKTKLSSLRGVVGVPLVEDDRIARCGKVEWLKPTLRHHYICNGAHGNSYAIGGAVAIHRDVFQKIGLMDEKYFLYFEDADLSIRAQKAWFKLIFLEEPKVHHQVSSTTKKLGSPLLLRYHYRNALYFNFKNGPWYINILVWPWSWWIIVKQVLKIMIYHNRDQSSAILRGVLDFYKNKMGKIQ